MAANPVVTFHTNQGDIAFELFADTKAATVENFLNYINSNGYDGTFFHRAVRTSNAGVNIIQAGGFTAFDPTFVIGENTVDEFGEVFTDDPIQNQPGISNLLGTLAMAKTSDPNSATSQFFVNVTNNTGLDSPTNSGGFTVFGKVVNGTMTTVNAIFALPTRDLDGNAGSLYDNVPLSTSNQLVVVESISGTGSVSGTIFNDVNRDGVQDAGENPLAGVTVFVDTNEDGAVSSGEISTTTGADGKYTLAGIVVDTLEPVSVLVRHLPANGLVALDSDEFNFVDVLIGTDTPDIDFADAFEGSVTGLVYRDADQDGHRDTNEDANNNFIFDSGEDTDGDGRFDLTEGVLVGVTVFADANNNGLLDSGEISTVTGANGIYTLSLPAGTHTIRQVPANGFIQVAPASVTVTVGTDEESGNDFRNFSDIFASFTIQVFHNDGTTLVTEQAPLRVGDSFKVKVFVQNPQPETVPVATEVQIAGVDLNFDAAKADFKIVPSNASNPTGVDLTFGPEYNRDPLVGGSSQATGLIDEIFTSIEFGSGNLPPLGDGVFLMFTVNMIATAEGPLNFSTSQADNIHRILVNDSQLRPGTLEPTAAQTSYGTASVNIVSLLQTTTDNLSVRINSTNQTLDVLANDIKNPLGTKSISAVVGQSSTGVATDTPNGTVTISADRLTLIYTPDAGFSGVDSFSYTLSDGTGATPVTGTVNVTVRNLPLANPDEFTFSVGAVAHTLDVLGNDQANEGKAKAITAFTSPAGGTVTQVGTTGLTYTPLANFSGTDTFTYTLSDGSGTTDTGTVTVTVVNQNPTGVADTLTTFKNAGVRTFNVLSNDTDADNTPVSNVGLTVSAVTQGDHGTVAIAAGGAGITYLPDTDYLGPDTFTYTVRDAQGATSVVNVNMTVANFIPSSLSGFVYVDSNGDGTRQTTERPVAGVTVVLAGTGDLAGVTSTKTTDPSGFYTFTDLAPGSYTITETQPAFLANGQTSPGSQQGTALVTNQIAVTLAQDTHGINNNFAERGLLIQFVALPDFFARRARENVFAAVNNANTPVWFSPTSSWADVVSAKVTLLNNNTQVQLDVTTTDGEILRTVISTSDPTRLRIRGTADGLTLVQIIGSFESFNFTNVGQTPVVTTTSTALAYSANAPATVIDAGLTVSDADSANLTGATVTISTNFATGQDVLAFTNQTGITGSFNATTGVLTLTGSATVAAYQAALRTITFASTAATPSTLPRTISFVVNDGSNSSPAATRNITVSVTSIAPVVTTTGTPLAYTENASATVIDAGLTVTDTDSTNLTGATVTLSNFVAGQDVLAFATQSNITGNFNATTGVLTLSGTATVAQYQAALRSITYVNNSDNPSTLARTLSIVVTDGTNTSVAATRTINVSAVNDAPTVTATSGALAYNENATTAVDSGLTVADVDSANLTGATVTISSGFVAGQDVLAFTTQGNISGTFVDNVLTLTGNATLAQYQAALRSVTYTNTSNNPSTAARTISFTVNDGTTNSAAATRSITITVANDAPEVTTTGTSLSYTVGSAATSIDAGLVVIDADSATLTSATVTITNFVAGQDVVEFTPNNATMGNIAIDSLGGGVLTLTSAGATATVAQWQAALRAVKYSNSSGTPNTTARIVSIVVSDGTASSEAATRAIAFNQAPSAVDDGSVGTPIQLEQNSLNNVINVLANDTDPDAGQTATLIIVSTSTPNQGGTVTIDEDNGSKQLLYTPAVNYVGPETFTYTISDGQGGTSTATVTVNLNHTNDLPIVITTGTTLEYTENGPALAIDEGLTVTDGDNATLASATVTLTTFVAGQDVLAFVNDGATMGNIAVGNNAGGVLTLVSDGATATLAQWQEALRAVKYSNTSENPTTANRTVSFVVNDGTANSPAANRLISVVAQNDAPVTTTTVAPLAYSGTAPVSIDAFATVSDLDNATLASATVTLTTFVVGQDVLSFTNDAPTMGNIAIGTNVGGVLTLVSDGASATLAQWRAALRAVKYTNTSGTPDTTTRTVSFVVNDGADNSNLATRNITIGVTNAAPVVTATSGATAFTEGNNVISTAVVIDAGVIVADVDNGTLASATVSITGGFQAAEDVLAFVNDGSTMGNIAVESNVGGVLTLTSEGATATLAQWQAALQSVTYTNSSETPSLSDRTMSFTVNDGTTASVVSTKTVTVAATNDTPVVTASAGTTAFIEGQDVASVPVIIDAGVTVVDVDSATLASATVSITGGFQAAEDVLAFIAVPATMGNIAVGTNVGGVLTLTSAGATATLLEWQAALRAVTYTNSSDAPNVTDRTVSIAVNDGAAASVVSTKTVSVAVANDKPVVTASAGTTAFTEGNNVVSTAVVIDAGVSVTDLDSPTLASATVSITTGFQTTEDALAFTNDLTTMGNIAGSYVAGTGILTLTSIGATATLLEWQAALRSVTYTNTSDTPNVTDRTVSFAVNDGTAASAVSTKTVTVAATNDTPVVTASAGTTVFTEGNNTVSLAVVIDAGVTVADVDSATLASATIAITGGFQAAEDVLSFANDSLTMGNIGIGSSVAGVLTLTSEGATATPLEWQAALRSVIYTNSSQTPDITDRTVSFAVNDGTVASAASTKTISITSVNDAPVVTTTTGTTAFTEGGGVASVPVIIDAGVSVADLDNATLASATVSITGGFQGSEDVLAFTNVPATMGNIEVESNGGGVLTLTSAGATATLAEWQAALQSVTYVNTSEDPNTADRTITFVVNDGAANSAPANRTITVAAANDNPVAAAHSDFGPTAANATLSITPASLVAGATDVDANDAGLLTVGKINGVTPVVGTPIVLASQALLTLNLDGTFTYDPNGKFESLGQDVPGSDEFSYTVLDGHGGESAPATVTIIVTGVNNAPVAVDDSPEFLKTDPITGNVLDNDTDVDLGDLLTVLAVDNLEANVDQPITLFGSASLTLSANGSYTLTPNGAFDSLLPGNEPMTDSFTYQIKDNSTGVSNTATVTITVNAPPA